MLSQKKCIPCETASEPMSPERAQEMLKEIPGWELAMDNKTIRRSFKFKDFVSALAFVNEIGKLAEEEGHHPDLMLGWGYVQCVLFTHKIQGLHENDFIMASKINALHNKG